MKTTAEYLDHYRAQRRGTRKLVAAIPEDCFDWAPSSSAFTVGDTVRHMMQAELFWRRLIVAAANGERYDPFNVAGDSAARLDAIRTRNLQASKSPKFGATAAECLERWAAIQADTERELAALAPTAFETIVEHPLAVMRGPVWEACLGMLEHEIHHRGQISAYLKVLGVEQPASLFD